MEKLYVDSRPIEEILADDSFFEIDYSDDRPLNEQREAFYKYARSHQGDGTYKGLPIQEYGKRFDELLEKEDWPALAELVGLPLSATLIRSFKRTFLMQKEEKKLLN